MKKFMLRVMPIVLVALVVLSSSVFALDVHSTFNKVNQAGQSGGSSTATNFINGVWGTVLTVLQILAVAAVVFAGVKYMFAGADEKANIKNGLLVLALGAIYVFGASTVVKLLINTVEDVG